MEPFIGQIIQFAGNFAPRKWALCDGSLLSISQYQALFSILGTTYGGDGRTTFALPDLRGRFAMHPGSGPGLTTRHLGEKSGSESETLTVNQLPAHNHHVNCTDQRGSTNFPSGNFMAADPDNPFFHGTPDKLMNVDTLTTVGGGHAHNNMPPFQAINYLIALEGTYPARN
ncbi:MAG: phage tail protein [bacterium]|nr:phage tail protein [bacterium]